MMGSRRSGIWLRCVSGTLACLMLVTGGTGWFAGEAAAHRINAAQSTLEHNPRTERLEVVHRVFLHDLEHAMATRFGRTLSLEPGSEDIEAALAWLAGQFGVSDRTGAPVIMQVAGAQIDGDQLVFYLESEGPARLDGLTIRNMLLMDVFPEQVNRLNIKGPGGVRTLVFMRDTPVQRTGAAEAPAAPRPQ